MVLDLPISATLRDYQEPNLQAARQLAGQLGLTRVTFAQGDAFDRAALAKLAGSVDDILDKIKGLR